MESKNLIYVALISGLFLYTGCTQREFTPETKSDEPIELQISPKVSLTRSVIQSGEQKGGAGKMTSIAVCASGTDYTAAKNNDYALYTWKLDGSTETWQSGTDKIYLTGEKATINAYHPAYKPGTDNEYSTTTTDALKPTNNEIPISVYEGKTTEATYTIDCTTNNADKVWKSGQWENNTANNLRHSAPGEVDYMWATAVSDVSNQSGNGITLNMNHALSLLTFRVYNDGSYTGTGALTKLKLEDIKNNGAILHKTPAANCTMNITTGAITGIPNATDESSDATFTRTISNYNLVTKGTADSETTPTDAPSASKKFSLLVFPITGITADDVKATFTIDNITYTVKLKAPTGNAEIGGNSTDTAGKWLAGVNYLYTVKLSGTGLSISTVNVTEWVDASGNELEIQ